MIMVDPVLRPPCRADELQKIRLTSLTSHKLESVRAMPYIIGSRHKVSNFISNKDWEFGPLKSLMVFKVQNNLIHYLFLFSFVLLDGNENFMQTVDAESNTFGNYDCLCQYQNVMFHHGVCLECVRFKDESINCNRTMMHRSTSDWNFGYISYKNGSNVLPLVMTSDGPAATYCPSSQDVITLKRYQDGVKAIKSKTIRVVTVQRAPFSTISGDQYSGVMFDILKVLQVKHNFSMDISLPPDGNFGNLARNQSGGLYWNGMVGQVINKGADIGAASFSITLERYRVVDFTMAIHQEPTAILIPAPTAGDKFTILVRPFEPEVWGMLFLTIFLLAPAFYLLHKLSLQYSTGTDKVTPKSFVKTMSEIFMFITGSLVQESVVAPVKRTRFLIAVWWMITLVLSNTYVGFLVSFLSAPKLYNSVNSLEELIHQHSLKWTFRKGTAHQNLFKSEGSTGIFKSIGDGVSEAELALSDVDGVASALTGRSAFIKEKSFLEFALGKDFESVKHCRLTLAKEEFFTVGIAYIVPKQSPILPLLNYEISNVIATGLMEKWKRMNWPKDLWCVDAASYIISTQPRTRKLNLGDFQGVSVLWVCGITSALLGFIVEHLRKRLTRFPVSAESRVQLQFTI